MPTSAKTGLSPAKVLGSGVNGKGIETFPIASGYATSIFTGDRVKLNNGKVERASAEDKDGIIGVAVGFYYTDASGTPTYKAYWPASTVSSDAVVRVVTDPNATFLMKADGTTSVEVGGIYGLNDDTAGDTVFGISKLKAKTYATAQATAINFSGVTDIGASTPITDNDAFTVATSVNTTPTTITIADGDGITELLAKINGVTGVSGAIDKNGYLVIKATDGGELRLDDTSGTPLVDMGILSTGETGELRISKLGGTNKLTATAIDFRDESDIPTNTPISATDAFLIQTNSLEGGGTGINHQSTVTIATGDGVENLLNKINAVPGIKASLEEGTGFLVIEGTEGSEIKLTESVGTPLADMGFFVGTTKNTQGAIKVIDVVDTDNDVVEVILTNHSFK